MRPMRIDSERKLVKECVRGNPAAQRQLYEDYGGKMYSLCLRYAKNEQLAQDILQDGFIRVYEKLDQFRNEGSLEGWIRRLMVNVAIRACQRQARLYVVTDLEEATHEAGPEQVEGSFAEQELLEMIRDLPDGFRLVFNMYAIEGYSHQEIANELGISEGTSKSQLSRARQSLQKMIEERWGETKKKKITNEISG
ncbi:MAG: RNA polymerase sigma factor [Bacteroidia bacterium]|nr:RNA polymerase sigma factor [Bacteroidia bacterium]